MALGSRTHIEKISKTEPVALRPKQPLRSAMEALQLTLHPEWMIRVSGVI